MKDYSNLLSTLADIVDTNVTHALSFELRRLSSKDRAEFAAYLRKLSDNDGTDNLK